MAPKDVQKPLEEVTAQILEIARGLQLSVHDDSMQGPQRQCAGSSSKPRVVYVDVHPQVGRVTTFCPENCSSIFALVPEGKTFRWDCKGVYGVAEDGRPLGA